MRRVPAPLAALLCLGFIQAFAWAVMLPAFQGQDERSHLTYTQRIVENGTIGWYLLDPIPSNGPGNSTEVQTADAWTGARSLELNHAMRPYGEQIEEDRWRRIDERLDASHREVDHYNAALRNPPLFPLYQALVYVPLRGTTILDRLYAMRLATIPFFLLAILGTWLLAGEVFGRRRLLQTLTAGVVALHPLAAQLGGVLNPDAAMAAFYAFGLWLTAVIVNRGATGRRAAGALAISAGAALTHPRAAPIVIPLLGALVVRAYPHVAARGRAWRAAALVAVGAGVLAIVAGGVRAALGSDITVGRVRDLGSYLWQFYLPRMPFMDPKQGVDVYAAKQVFVDRLFSSYSPLGVDIAPWILEWITVLTPYFLAALVVALVVRRAALRRHRALAVLLVSLFVGTMWGLHVGSYGEYANSGNPIITGRYLVPMLPLLGIAIAVMVSALPRRAHAPGAATVLSLGALLSLAAVGAALLRFYV